DTDRYGRTVGIVLVDGQNLNELIVRNGYAWVYRQYCKESFCSSWIQAEDAARQQQKGMWSDPRIIPPWEWRHQGEQRVAEVQPSVQPSAAPQKVEAATGTLHGNVNSHKFHRPGCRVYDCPNCT
ncbi:MAG: thermonuclease family protein, partial [Chlorobium sp.]|nr:thermonuclease family protein [Chlorobium sp.]